VDELVHPYMFYSLPLNCHCQLVKRAERKKKWSLKKWQTATQKLTCHIVYQRYAFYPLLIGHLTTRCNSPLSVYTFQQARSSAIAVVALLRIHIYPSLPVIANGGRVVL